MTSMSERLAAAVVAGTEFDVDDHLPPDGDSQEILLGGQVATDRETWRGADARRRGDSEGPGVRDEASGDGTPFMVSWDPQRVITADQVFALLRGHGLPNGCEPHPRGIQICGAWIKGRLALDHLDGKLPLVLSDCLLSEGISARGTQIPLLALRRCSILGYGATPLDLTESRILKTLELVDCIVSTAAGAAAIDLRGARVAGNVSLSRTQLYNTSGSALNGDVCTVEGTMVADSLVAEGAGVEGTIRLIQSHIGHIALTGAQLTNTTGPAFAGDGLHVDGDVFLDSGFTAHGSDSNASVTLSRADIAGLLNCDGAKMYNDTGPALRGGGLHATHVLLGNGFRATGAGESGTVVLANVRIDGMLVCSGDVELRNGTGPALTLDQCRVDQGVFLTDGFTAHGNQEETIRLPLAVIGGPLDCGGAQLNNETAPAIEAQMCDISGEIGFNRGFSARGGGDRAVIDLGLGRGRRLILEGGKITHASDSRKLLWLDGFTCRHLPRPAEARWWTSLLAEQTPGYAAQPYQHLASLHRAAGHDRDTRRILMAQRRDQIRRGTLTVGQRIWGRFTGVFLGYGWAPARALYSLGATFVVSVFLAVLLGGHGALNAVSADPSGGAAIPTVNPASTAAVSPPAPCTVVERIGVGLDLGTPFLGTATKSRERCAINRDPDSATATALTAATWALQVLAWGWTALFVAGFTGAVRKT